MSPADLDAIRAGLRCRAEDVARHHLGEPNPRQTTRRQVRFGSKGAVAVEIAGDKAGLWKDQSDGHPCRAERPRRAHSKGAGLTDSTAPAALIEQSVFF